MEDVAATAFSAQARAALADCTEPRRTSLFFHTWTLFEALGKASGKGIVGWTAPTISRRPTGVAFVCGRLGRYALAVAADGAAELRLWAAWGANLPSFEDVTAADFSPHGRSSPATGCIGMETPVRL